MPIALHWTNSSENGVKRRSWGPMGIIGDAMQQIPAGEFGIIYAAYQEGARERIADLRTEGVIGHLRDCFHRDSIRIPLVFLLRLYARPLNDGQPDLIESTVKFFADYTEPALAGEFPSNVFTRM